MSYDGGATWSSGPLAAFETHLVMDNQAQVFTYNWHWLTNTNANANGAITYPKSSPTTAASLPSSVCMRAWLAEVGTEDSTGLEETCFDLNTTWVSTDAEAHDIADGVACLSGYGEEGSGNATPVEVTGTVSGNTVRLVETWVGANSQCLLTLRSSEPASDGSLTLTGSYSVLGQQGADGKIKVTQEVSASPSTANSRSLVLLELLFAFVAGKLSR